MYIHVVNVASVSDCYVYACPLGMYKCHGVFVLCILCVCVCVLFVDMSCMHLILSLFFLFVGEKFEIGIQDAIILESDEARLVTAQEEFVDITEDGK